MPEVPADYRDLLDAEFATLATLDKHGRPQLSEVWFLTTDDTVQISLNTARRKVKNLQHDPACSVLILDLANPHRYLEIRGDARITPDADLAFADKVGAKYGVDLRQMDQPGETRVVVTVEATRVRGWGGPK